MKKSLCTDKRYYRNIPKGTANLMGSLAVGRLCKETLAQLCIQAGTYQDTESALNGIFFISLKDLNKKERKIARKVCLGARKRFLSILAQRTKKDEKAYNNLKAAVDYLGATKQSGSAEDYKTALNFFTK